MHVGEPPRGDMAKWDVPRRNPYVGGVVDMCGDSRSLGGRAADDPVLATAATVTRRAGSQYPSKRKACCTALATRASLPVAAA